MAHAMYKKPEPKPNAGGQYGRCPMCQQPILPADSIEEKLSPGEISILRLIRNAGPKGTNGPAIWAEIYGKRADGGPKSPNIISVQVKNLKKKLEGSDVIIKTEGLGPHSRYIYRKKEDLE